MILKLIQFIIAIWLVIGMLPLLHAAKLVRQNPFEPLELEQAQRDDRANSTQYINSPLNSYPLNSLKLVGCLAKHHSTWALIAAPTGMIYPITLGDHLGMGKVIKINTTAIAVQQVNHLANKALVSIVWLYLVSS